MRKRRWFFLGLLGTVVGLAVRLVKARRRDPTEVGRWESPNRSEGS
jgi:hypothetical protein